MTNDREALKQDAKEYANQLEHGWEAERMTTTTFNFGTDHFALEGILGQIELPQHFRVDLPGASNWWQHILAFMGVRRYWERRTEFDGILTHSQGEGKVRITSPVEYKYVRPLLWRADIGL